jgi:hypothetical protein
MPSAGSRTFFHRKSSKASIPKVLDIEPQQTYHARSMSTSSTSSSVSHTSSVGSSLKSMSFDPLSLHPPLSLNASPCIAQEHQIEEEHINNTTTQSPSDDQEPFYYNKDCRRRTSVYDNAIQWPLKDWQAVPPAELADLSNAQTMTPTTPAPADQRRPPKEGMSAMDMFVKRGDWKRRGIVFELDSDAEDEQEQHFELPDSHTEFPFI